MPCPQSNIENWARAMVPLIFTALAISACVSDSQPSGETSLPGTLPQPLEAARAIVEGNTTLTFPLPTPHPGNTPWVDQRLEAVILLYGLSGPGAALLRSLDLRQMRGEPGYFGSYGFDSWTGVGEAKPIGVMHELSHAYWGGFPVTGHPELSWETAPGEARPPAVHQYQADILTFMTQPPDQHEVFRQRLRNLPALSQDNTESLFHNLEADLVYSTGGHLALVPPILRKYWDRFLVGDSPAHLSSWDQAVAWYESLEAPDRTTANQFLGFEHLDLRLYRPPGDYSGPTDPLEEARRTVATEERQRLFDVADQFQLLLGDPQNQENFQFWRGYLRDKLRLHQGHPGFLSSLDLPSSQEIVQALEFLSSITDLSPEDQGERLENDLQTQPFLVNFLPTLDNRTLLELFSLDPALPQGTTLQATASFVDRLERFESVVDSILAHGKDSPDAGARELSRFLEQTDLDKTEDVKLFFGLFRDADHQAASRVVLALETSVFSRLLEPVPFQLRAMLTPKQLLSKLGVSAGASPPEIIEGITLILENPSGNFLVDEPFLTEIYALVAGLGESEPRTALNLLGMEKFPLEGFIQQQPRAAVKILAIDPATATELVKSSDVVLAPPARIIYRLIYADPRLAARLTAELDETPEDQLAVESLAYLAYNDFRLQRAPRLPISLERDGEFLTALLEIKGNQWLSESLDRAFVIYGQRAAQDQVPGDFLLQFRATLEATAATLLVGEIRDRLATIIRNVVQRHTGAG